MAFFVKPSDVDPRFGLGVGGFFGAVANTYTTASLLPDTGVMSLADSLNALGMATIFVSLLGSVISLYLYDIRDEKALSRRLDALSVQIIAAGYVALNVALAWAAAA